MDNGTFVDNMLYHIQEASVVLQDVFDALKGYYTKDGVGVSDYIYRQIRKIDQRVKDMLDVIDPMWYVVALYHRNKGGLWRDMHKYGVKKEYVSSYKVETASADPIPVHTQEQQN